MQKLNLKVSKNMKQMEKLIFNSCFAYRHLHIFFHLFFFLLFISFCFSRPVSNWLALSISCISICIEDKYGVACKTGSSVRFFFFRSLWLLLSIYDMNGHLIATDWQNRIKKTVRWSGLWSLNGIQHWVNSASRKKCRYEYEKWCVACHRKGAIYRF